MEDRNARIYEQSDSEFLSFLYAERDRENSLSQFQGWNNWAIAGAIVTIVCAIYTICKNTVLIDSEYILYGFTGAMALYLLIKAYSVFFMRKRGYNRYCVRVLKEQIPKVDLILIIISSICAIAVAIWNGYINSIFWLWGILLVMHLVSVVFAFIYRDKVMPAYYEDFYFHNFRVHVTFSGLVGGFCTVMLSRSLRYASYELFYFGFEIGVCAAALMILVSLLFKINTGNKSIRNFDAIIDRYIYAGASKTDTFRQIQRNRVGYWALEVCSDEIAIIKDALEKYDEKEKELDRIAATVKNCNCDDDEIKTYLEFTDDILKMMLKTVKVSKNLTRRLNDIITIIPDYNKIEDLSCIIDMNCKMADRLELLTSKVEGIIRTLRGRLELLLQSYC